MGWDDEICVIKFQNYTLPVFLLSTETSWTFDEIKTPQGENVNKQGRANKYSHQAVS